MGIRHLASIRETAEEEGRELTEEDRGHFERVGSWLDQTVLALEEWM